MVDGIPGHDNTKPLEAWRRRFASATTCIRGAKECKLGNLHPFQASNLPTYPPKPPTCRINERTWVMLLKAAILHRLTPVCWQPTARKASNLPLLGPSQPFMMETYSPQSLRLACFAPNSPLFIDHLQPPKQSNLPVLRRTHPFISTTYNPQSNPTCLFWAELTPI